MKVSFERVETDQQVNAVFQLANTIWTEHYVPIIGKDQVEYMLRNFHSLDIISNEIDNENNRYYLISRTDRHIGYIGIKLEKETLFLSKIYISSEMRGCGCGSQAIEFIKEIASSNNLGNITLTINRNNSNSIAAYKKIGFQITGEICADIGEGYVMDDYKMELKV